MHLLFILPVTALFLVFANVVSGWMRVACEKNGKKKGIILLIVMCSILAVVVIVLLSLQIKYTVNDDLGMRLLNSGETNISIAVLYFVYIIEFLVIGFSLIARAKKITGAVVDVHKSDMWGLIKRMTICSIIASVCFGIYGGMMIWEGAHLVKYKQFIYGVVGEYTAPWWLEFIYLILQVTPGIMLLIINYGNCKRKPKKAKNSDVGLYVQTDPYI